MANSLNGPRKVTTRENDPGAQAPSPAAGLADFAAIQNVRSRWTPSVIDGFLAVMLVQYAHWSAEQTGRFLGLDVAGVEEWNRQYLAKGLDGLHDLPPPRRDSGVLTPGVLAAGGGS